MVTIVFSLNDNLPAETDLPSMNVIIKIPAIIIARNTVVVFIFLSTFGLGKIAVISEIT